MSLYQETKFLMDKYHLRANKQLGQNFLIDETVVEDMVKAAKVDENDLVIEIGPGLGTLTNALIEKAGKVIAIELDERMIEILQERFNFYKDKFEIIHQDVLKVDLKEKIEEEKSNNENIKKVKIVANLPYYITTPIIMSLLEKKLPIESITVMIQKEVAQRLTATPGDKYTGAITYAVSYYANPSEIRIVENTSFIPEPEVESEVICLEIRKEPKVLVKDEKRLFDLIKISFMQRRKTLLNSLANGNFASKEQAKKVLDIMGLDEKVRGEKLTLEQFAKMAELLEEEK